MTFEQIIKAYLRTTWRADLSWYSKSTRMRREGAARRYRVTMRRNGFQP